MHRQLTDKEIMLRTVYLNNNFESEQEKKECEELLNRIKKDWLTNEVVDISGGGIGFFTPSCASIHTCPANSIYGIFVAINETLFPETPEEVTMFPPISDSGDSTLAIIYFPDSLFNVITI